MKTIGQFAKENNITVKTLHHYEKLELIIPTRVDPNTGYRYYSDEESLNVKIILFMKDLGFSLSEIKNVLSDNVRKEELIGSLSFKLEQASNELDNTSNRIYKLETVISIIDDKKLGKTNMKELIGMSEKELHTGKHGRGKFTEETVKMFNKARQENTNLSAIQMDLDRFHEVNKKHGYDVGDIVLRRTTDEIVNVLKEHQYTTMLQRKGGDEFSVIAETNTREAAMLATKILNRVVSIDYSDVADDLKVSISAGIAGLTKSTVSYSDLIHQATIKLYESKRNR